MKLLLRSAILFSYLTFSFPAHAKDLVSSFDMMQNDAFSRYSTGNEYMEGQEPGTVLMKVNLWGAVKKPGIHHIPVKTDLISLMSYAGGPNDNAIMDNVVIKRQQGKQQKKITVDLAQVIHGENREDLTLQPDDIVVVEARQPMVSQDTFMLVVLASTVASTILTAILINHSNK